MEKGQTKRKAVLICHVSCNTHIIETQRCQSAIVIGGKLGDTVEDTLHGSTSTTFAVFRKAMQRIFTVYRHSWL